MYLQKATLGNMDILCIHAEVIMEELDSYDC